MVQGVLGKGGKGKDPVKLSGPRQGGNRAHGVLGDFGVPTQGNSHNSALSRIWDSPGFGKGLFPVPQPQACSTERGCGSCALPKLWKAPELLLAPNLSIFVLQSKFSLVVRPQPLLRTWDLPLQELLRGGNDEREENNPCFSMRNVLTQLSWQHRDPRERKTS